MISFDEALRLIGEVAHPCRTERVPISSAAGCVLAEPVVARVDSPPADSSAMDGYAVCDDDLPGSLRVAGESFAGCAQGLALEPGTCMRIFTGAPVPVGADRVVIQEQVERSGDIALFSSGPGEARHVRAKGSDFRAGDLVVPSGQLMTPRALVAAAAADWGDVEVWRRPKVLVLATGDELAPPGTAHLRTGAIPESVSFGVAALVEAWGGRVIETVTLPDDVAAMEHAAGDALECADLVIVTGGASVGERDFAKLMFESHGLECIFSKIAIKPGKPVWLGRAQSRLVLGLPGNPTSALVTGRLLLAPLVAGLAGRECALEWFELPLAEDLPPCGDRETFVRARRLPAGASPIGNQDSSAQRALLQADLLLRRHPHAPSKSAGETVEAIAF